MSGIAPLHESVTFSQTIKTLPLSIGRTRDAIARLLRGHERPFLSHVLSLGGGTAIGQVAVLLSAPFVTRLYTPDDMGLFSLFVAFLSFVCVGTGLRYETAVVSAENEREAGELACASILAAVPVALVFGLVLLGMIRFDLISYGQLPYWSIPVVVFLLIITQLFLSLRYWYVRRSEFTIIGKVLVVQGLGRAVVPVIAGVASLGWVGLLLGEAAGRMLGVHRMLAGPKSPWSAIARGRTDHGSLFHTCRKYWKFPAIVLPSSLLDALALAIPFPIVASLFGTEKTGWFFLVMRLGMLPAAFVTASVSDVFHARVSEDYRAGTAGLRLVVVRTAANMLKVGALVYVPVAILSPVLFGALFGRAWAPAGVLMTILAPLARANLVVSPLSRLLWVADRPETKLIVDILLLSLPALGLVLGHHLHWSFAASLLAYTLVSVALYGLYFAIIVSVSGASLPLKDVARER